MHASYASVVYHPDDEGGFMRQMIRDDNPLIKRYKNFRVHDPMGHKVTVSVQCDSTCKCAVQIDGMMHQYPFLPFRTEPFEIAEAISFEVGLLVDGSFKSPPSIQDATVPDHPADWPVGSGEPVAFQHPLQVQALLDRVARDVHFAQSV